MRLNKNEESTINEINVTPFIDIMLVLLIIFMIVAKISVSSFGIKLPSSEDKQDNEQKQIVISLDNSHNLYFNNTKITMQNLNEYLEKEDIKQVVFLQIDKEVKYDDVVKLINKVKESNFLNISLLTKSDDW